MVSDSADHGTDLLSHVEIVLCSKSIDVNFHLLLFVVPWLLRCFWSLLREQSCRRRKGWVLSANTTHWLDKTGSSQSMYTPPAIDCCSPLWVDELSSIRSRLFIISVSSINRTHSVVFGIHIKSVLAIALKYLAILLQIYTIFDEDYWSLFKQGQESIVNLVILLFELLNSHLHFLCHHVIWNLELINCQFWLSLTDGAIFISSSGRIRFDWSWRFTTWSSSSNRWIWSGYLHCTEERLRRPSVFATGTHQIGSGIGHCRHSLLLILMGLCDVWKVGNCWICSIPSNRFHSSSTKCIRASYKSLITFFS